MLSRRLLLILDVVINPDAATCGVAIRKEVIPIGCKGVWEEQERTTSAREVNILQ
jgi:hypothetical protein